MQKQMYIALILTASVVSGATVLLIACRGIQASTVTDCPHDSNLSTYDQWVRQVRFPYVAPPDKLRRVRESYNRVGIGSSKDEIIEAFGLPDFEQEASPKKSNPPCIGYEFLYYFEKPSSMISNEFKDKRIAVFFSPAGKTTWIVGNVGLPEKGSPARRQ